MSIILGIGIGVLICAPFVLMRDRQADRIAKKARVLLSAESESEDAVAREHLHAALNAYDKGVSPTSQ